MNARNNINTLRIYSVCLLTAFLITGCGASMTHSLSTMPPGGQFKKVSSLVALPDYLPGLGSLYVDPGSLPAGPFLGYDRSGKLVHITYMIPVKDIESRKKFNNLGATTAGMPVDHTDMVFNPGHPGVPEPHYHFTQWLIGADEKKKL